MPSTYGGATFWMLAEEKDGVPSRPLMVPTEWGVVRTKIPYADQEQVQLTGKGNRRLEIKCEMYNDALFLDVVNIVGNGYPGPLVTEWGETIANLYLVEMKDVWRVTFQEEIHFTLVFEHIG